MAGIGRKRVSKGWIATDPSLVTAGDQRTILSIESATAVLAGCRGPMVRLSPKRAARTKLHHGYRRGRLRARYARVRQQRGMWTQQDADGSWGSRRRRVTACHWPGPVIIALPSVSFSASSRTPSAE